MPQIGHPESYYAEQVRMAEHANQIHAREAAKVGQYVTLGMDPHLDWESKRRYFRHALRRHCEPPAVSDDLVSMYYQRLGDFVRRHSGEEALRLASREDDLFMNRLRAGEPRGRVLADAKAFYDQLLGPLDHCPSHFNEEDWGQLKMIRNQWVADEPATAEG